MNVIETVALNFSYGKRQVLKNLSLQVPEGAIYGLLGRNGAGKTTALRLLLGLLPVREGKVKFWETEDYDHRIFFRIGSMIETPALYSHLTVEEHLAMFNILFKQPPSYIDETLAVTGLAGERTKKASRLSTGLKQRLAIAIALFRNPDLLILDEPINGLDPLGIIDVRTLLLNLQKEGKTILLSSHIISEMEKLCSHVGIIEDGTLRFQGDVHSIPEKSLESFYLSILQKQD